MNSQIERAIECDDASLKEIFVLGGSTALAPLVNAAGCEFSRRACARDVDLRNEGSWSGIADVASGFIDAAFCDVEFEMSMNELTSYPLVAFTIAFVANPSASVTALTMKQLVDILTGNVRNWDEVGGANCPITLINRTHASGVRSIVEQIALAGSSIVDVGHSAESNRLAAEKVKNTPGGFSYVALPDVRTLDVVPLAIDGVPADNEHVLYGMYSFWAIGRVLALPKLRDIMVRFVDYIVGNSDLGDLLGYITLNRMSIGEHL